MYVSYHIFFCVIAIINIHINYTHQCFQIDVSGNLFVGNQMYFIPESRQENGWFGKTTIMLYNKVILLFIYNIIGSYILFDDYFSFVVFVLLLSVMRKHFFNR